VILKRIAIIVLLWALVPPVQGDELVLHEGKIIKGKILKEEKTEVMIRLANNMFLRVDKSKIREIHRDDRGPVRRTVTMETIKASSTTAKSPAAAQPVVEQKAPVNVPVLAKTGPMNVKPDTTVMRKEKGDGAGIETVRVQTYVVTGKTFDEVEGNIMSRDYGKGPLKDGHRMASLTTLDFSWDGKPRIDAGKTKWAGVVMTSTITILYPEWKAPAAVDEASVNEWNAFIADLQDHDKGHLDIYRSEMRLLNETLSNLDAANEDALRSKSKAVVSEWRERVERRQDGHDRRDRASAKASAGKTLAPKK
jgi:predicted secreted Zn-dependent protease